MTWGAVLGTISGAQTTIQSSGGGKGTATATFTATSVGSGSASATVDYQTSSAIISITAPNVGVTKTDRSATAVPGSTTTYTIVVSNSGNAEAPGTSFSDSFPASITSATWTSTASGGASGNAASGSGNISQNLILPIGGSVTYTVTANISSTATGSLSNTATVSQVDDVTSANNSATDTDNLIPPSKVFNLPSTGDNTVVLESIPGGTMLKLTVTTVGSPAVVTIFEGQFLQSITINGSFRNKKITVKNLGTYAGEMIVNGGDGNDMIDTSAYLRDATLTGGGGNDVVNGGAGDDQLSGGIGNDNLNGDAGIDCVVEIIGASTVTLTNTSLVGLGNDKLTSIECTEIFGNDQNNFFDASKFTLGGVKLHGGGGNDTLLGTPFSDTLDGGDGNNTIRQSSANDQKVVNDSATGAGTDSLLSIESVSLTNSGSTGRVLDSTMFVGSATLNGGSGNDTL